MADNHRNFSYSTVATAPSPNPLSSTSLVVSAGDGTKFPTPPFNATVWPANSQPSTSNAEIVRVTGISTDTFTITRTQESSTNRSIQVGDQIAATITAKVIDDRVADTGDTMTGLLQFSGTDHAGIKLNSLTTTQRDALTPSNGLVIYNSTVSKAQRYENGIWSDVSLGFINVRDYGAKGDNSTDDTTAISNAMDAANSSGSVLIFPYGVYKCGYITKSYSVQIIGFNATIKATNITDWTWNFVGSLGSSVALTSNVAQSAVAIPVTTTGFSANDLILIGDDSAPYSGQPTRYRGQLVEVYTIDSSSQLTTKQPIYYGFTTANNAFIAKVTSIDNLSIKGLRFLQNNPSANTAGFINVTYGKNVDIDVDGQGAGEAGVLLIACYKFRVKHNAQDYLDQAVTGLGNFGYGVSAQAASCNGYCEVNATRVRHAFVAAGLDGNHGEPQNIVVTGVANATTSAAWDVHAQGYNITFNNCQAIGCLGAGFELRSNYSHIQGGIAENCTAGVWLFENPSYNNIKGLNIKNIISGGDGIFSNLGPTFVNGLTISDCDISNIDGSAIACYNGQSELSVHNNRLSYYGRAGASGKKNGVLLDVQTLHADISHNRFFDNGSPRTSINALSVSSVTGTDIIFTDNEVQNSITPISGSGASTVKSSYYTTGTFFNSGSFGLGVTPTAILHLKAGTATANTAPLKLTTGTALTTPEDGAMEYHSSHIYFTIGSTRYQLDQQTAADTAQYVTLATDSTLGNERVLTGTTNQITVTDNGAGSTVVLSTPQNINTTATPTFGSLTLSGASGNTLAVDTSTLIVDATNHKVGVGTIGPSLKLESNGGTNGVVNTTNSTAIYFDTASNIGKIVCEKSDFTNTARTMAFFIRATEVARFDTSGNFGIACAPTNVLSLGGNSARTIWMERHTTNNTAGNSLTIQSGGTKGGAVSTDKAAGDLILGTGISTGTGASKVRIQTNTTATSTGTGDNSAVDRVIVTSPKALTDGSATNLVSCTIASGSSIGGILRYAIEVTDGTDFQCETGEVFYSAVNKGGTVTTTINELNSQQALSSAATLATTWAISAASPAVISVNADTSLTASTGYPRITFVLENLTQQAVAIQ